jgi:prophage antirepressor-like protein
MTDIRLAIFKGKKIRRTIYNNQWWFVVEDVVFALTDTANPKDYINKIRRRDNELNKGYGQFVHTLFIDTVGGIGAI